MTNLHDEEHSDVVHAASVGSYLANYFALLGLLIITVAVARVDLGILNMYAAMLIAMVKTVLVVLFFMHLGKAGRLSRIWALTGIFFFLIMIGLNLTDYSSRHMDATSSPTQPQRGGEQPPAE
jgi:cytochrome c oxidase subunit 4